MKVPGKGGTEGRLASQLPQKPAGGTLRAHSSHSFSRLVASLLTPLQPELWGVCAKPEKQRREPIPMHRCVGV